MSTENTDIVDFIELINYTLSSKFLDNWRFKYGEKFLKNFQLKIFEAVKKRKPIKLKTLIFQLRKNNKYSEEQVINFFNSIDIDIYRPVVTGKY